MTLGEKGSLELTNRLNRVKYVSDLILLTLQIIQIWNQ